jgi:hypothetical protein
MYTSPLLSYFRFIILLHPPSLLVKANKIMFISAHSLSPISPSLFKSTMIQINRDRKL